MYYRKTSKPKEKILTVRVNADLIEKLDTTAKKIGVTRSKLIKAGIEKAIEETTEGSADEIIKATKMMMSGKSIKPSPGEWESIEAKLKSSAPIHKTLKEAMEFLRGTRWEET